MGFTFTRMIVPSYMEGINALVEVGKKEERKNEV